MGKCNDIDNVLKRNGTGQGERFVAQLHPSLFELNDFDVEDWILFTYNFAKHVNYFDTKNSDTTKGDWQEFFNYFNFDDAVIPFRASRAYKKKKEHITEVLAGFKKEGTLTSHLTLFVSFLQLLEHSKTRFNGITKRHLDFYYKDILQVDKRAATPDQVHVIFELAKKSVEERIVEDTELNGKVDANGNQRIYKTDEELIANQAKVASLKTVYQNVSLQEIKASPVANTLDGSEEPLPEDAPYWLPFGYTSEEKKYTELPDAAIGFAIASPLLLLKEGVRTVQVTLNFAAETIDTGHQLTDFNATILKNILTVSGSGEEEWVGPIGLKTVTDTTTNMSTRVISNNQLILAFQLSKDIPAFVGYNDEFLLEKYNTTFPVTRFSIDTSKPEGVSFHRATINRILTSIQIKVDVQEASSVHIENDNGLLKQNKPFFPFTPQPIKASNFYIHYEEAFAKAWKEITVNFSWKNTPDDFAVWYDAYKKNAIPGQTSNDAIVANEAYFTATKEVLHKENWIPVGDGTQILFKPTTETPEETPETSTSYHCTVEINNENFDIDKTGPIRLRLDTSFLHDLFPRLYASSLIGNTVSTATIVDGVPVVNTTTTEGNIPNPPYTPIAENITISYTAEETRQIQSQILPIDTVTPITILNQKDTYAKERIKLFHVHPFGQCEEHNYLKIKKHQKGIKDVYDTTNIHSYLVPRYCDGGELFIGLKDAQVQQNIALLIQVLEGSENPQVPSFGEREEIQWAILCDNAWKSLTDDILSNNTDNFLNSGIVKFAIPRQATQQNTRLPEGYIWVRAKMHKAYDAVCKAIDIHTQAVRATFEDNDNELSHLDKGLEAGSIKKLITRIPQVKGVSQPYSSFSGIPEESDMRFYRRISERLRHKNRAITLWDYEHLILQEFPEVFKVKCLNHTYIKDENDTTKDNYVAAGHVTLVVIPDSVNKNVFDIYQPRVSKGLITRIKSFINQQNTLHVTADVMNPRYEEVSVTLEVEFLKGYDERFYTKQLEEDIIKFLSPWAFDNQQTVAFGIDLHRSILIDYIEKLSYVDYLQNVVIQKDGVVTGNVVTPSTPRSILVSAKSHIIRTVLTPCKDKKAQEKLLCQ
ncbi:baseplate J/gp47 family protein [Dokdonia ponticola]|uniref:Baseplate J/gp47 family protein n=1 Tax=Dokdonia ponticola TaxID=2041041 RepID=A0ABV9I0G5_9FLAO